MNRPGRCVTRLSSSGTRATLGLRYLGDIPAAEVRQLADVADGGVLAAGAALGVGERAEHPARGGPPGRGAAGRPGPCGHFPACGAPLVAATTACPRLTASHDYLPDSARPDSQGKRLMYGRANPDLLSRRILLSN